MSTYRVTFKDNRVGRNHNVEPFTIEARNDEEVARVVLKAAAPHLASRFPDIEWNKLGRNVTGWVTAGFRVVAQFTAEEVEPS